ncbi:MAG: C4-type zinc ribbon domain-containing protein [Massilibacteroides sp.]|nr:C4-type zinc ribbon domain-containing protein [Massilibacteroides sp.]
MAAKKQAKKELTIEEKLTHLYKLQQTLSEIDRIKTLRGELPLEVKDLEDEIVGLKTRLDKFTEGIKELETTVTGQKAKKENCLTLIERYKKQLNDIHNNREYDNLSKEIEFQGLESEFAEKKINELKERIEKKQEEIAELQKNYDERKIDLEHKNEKLESIVEETKIKEEKLLNRGKKLENNIEPRLLHAFERIRSGALNGLAVVYIQRNACGGCFNKIPPQKQLDIRLHKKIMICEYCGRIIIDPAIAGIKEEEVVEEKGRGRGKSKSKSKK